MKPHAPHVRAVKALTRWHFTARRATGRMKRAVAHDRRRSGGWGWHENIVGLGVSWKTSDGRRERNQLCLTFFVLRKEPLRKLGRSERIPETLRFDSLEHEVLTDVVVVPGQCVAHGAVVRPVRPKCEVGHQSGGRGTAGPIVTRNGQRLLLSCSHAIARSGDVGETDRGVEQPVADDAGIVGRLVEFTRIQSGSTNADIALARLTVQGDPRILGTPITPKFADPRAADEYKVDERVILYGAASGASEGRVKAFQSTWVVTEVPFVNGAVTYTNLVAYDASTQRGDSGGLVMSNEDGSKSRAVGIHTAGLAVADLGLFQPIGPIMKIHGLQLA